MTPQILIYGANGYSASLAAEELKKFGVEFIVAGRSETSIKKKASEFGVPYRVFSADADDFKTIDEGLKGIKVFVNGAGPYVNTADPFMDACIRNGVHYTDIAAELYAFQAADRRDEAAKKAGVTLLPGGGGVAEVFLDVLVGHVVERIKNPVKVDQVLDINGPVTRGTIGTIRTFKPEELVKRVDGKLVQNEFTNTATWDLRDGRGPLTAPPSADPQLATLWKGLGVPNIRTFIVKSGGELPTAELESLPIGPTLEEREATPYNAAVEVTGADGSVGRAVLHFQNGYTMTALATAKAAMALLSGEKDIKAGYQTPLMTFGSHYLEEFPGATIEDF